MTTTDVIALLAFLVALYGAILSTFIAYKERFKLNLKYLNSSYISLSSSSNDTYVNEIGEHFIGYNRDTYVIAILVRITNKSKSPTTINEFILNKKYTLNSSFNIHNTLIPKSFKERNSVLICSNFIDLKQRALTPLIEIQPLSTVEGYLIFTQIEEVPNLFNITIDAVQKPKTFKLNFKISNDYRNNIK